MEKNKIKIGVCGLACGKCVKYTVQKKCPGCRPNEFCPLPACAEEKKSDYCFNCKEFPCQKNYEKGPIVPAVLDYWKDKNK